jgi:hypothetical protein
MARLNINASTATTNSMTQKLRQQQNMQIMSSLEQHVCEDQPAVLLGDAIFPIVDSRLSSWDSFGQFDSANYSSGDVNIDSYEYQQRAYEMAEPTRKHYR